MANSLKIKVCGMRDPNNIKAISSFDIDYMGFIFYPPSKRFVGENVLDSIFKSVQGNIQKVGVFVNEPAKTVIDICKKYGLQVAQLHGKETPDECRKVKESGFELFKAFSIGDTFDFNILNEYVGSVDYFLFDTKGKLPGGTGMKFNWEILNQYKLNVPFFLSGGISLDDVDAVLNFSHPQLYALDINSGFEIAPALKDAEKVQRYLEEIRNVQ